MTSGKEEFKTHCFITPTCAFIGSVKRRGEAAKGFSETYFGGKYQGRVHVKNQIYHLSTLS